MSAETRGHTPKDIVERLRTVVRESRDEFCDISYDEIATIEEGADAIDIMRGIARDALDVASELYRVGNHDSYGQRVNDICARYATESRR